MDIHKTIIYLGYFFLGLNTILFFQSYRVYSVAFKIFCFYLLYCSIIQILTVYFKYEFKSNLFLSHYYFIGQFVLLSLFYRKIILKKRWKDLISVLSVIILIYLSINFIREPSLYNTFYLTEIVLCSLPLVFYSILYFTESFGVENKQFLIINSGVFLYLLCSTLIFASGNLMPNLPKDVNRLVWIFNVSFYLIYQILVFIEWYKNFRKQEITNTP